MIGKLATLTACTLLLTACGRFGTTPPDPVFDKIGNASCAPGYHATISKRGKAVCTRL